MTTIAHPPPSPSKVGQGRLIAAVPISAPPPAPGRGLAPGPRLSRAADLPADLNAPGRWPAT